MLDTTFSERRGYRPDMDGERYKIRVKVLSGPSVMVSFGGNPEVVVVVKLLEPLPGLTTLQRGVPIDLIPRRPLIRVLVINGDELPEVGKELVVDYYTNYYRNGPPGHAMLSLGVPYQFTY